VYGVLEDNYKIIKNKALNYLISASYHVKVKLKLIRRFIK
jgi:hypothetical protein